MKSVGCTHLDDFLDDYLDGELAARETCAFEQHVAHCAACQEAVRESRAVERLLHVGFSTGEVQPQASAPAALGDGEPARGAHGSQRERPVRGRRTIAACLATMAAALVVWAAAWSFWGHEGGPPRQRVRAARQEVGPTPKSRLTEAAANPARVLVQLSPTDEDDFVPVRLASHHENVTVVWMYPVQRTTP
jgi:predicted anti-sigma-YlaC factor YlaD